MAIESIETKRAEPSVAGAFEAHTNEVYGWAYRLLGRHHDALDVVQDVFLKWIGQCESETPNHTRGWLRRVTINRSIDVIRERRRMEDANELVRPDAASLPRLTGVEHDELREDVAVALDTLTDVQRSILVAKVYDGMTFAKIAEELGIAVSTVKTHYVRAIGHVSVKLQPGWTPEDRS